MNIHNDGCSAERHFAFPHELIDDPSLSLSQKRAILSEWASDSCAVASFPTLRRLPGTNLPVTFSAIMDARAQLDRIESRRQEKIETAEEARRGVLVAFSHRRALPGLCA
jgi:hypothetical protein